MSEWIEKEICIGEIKDLLNDYEIQVDSPDGYVGVNFFVDKGEWEEYVLEAVDGSFEPVICNCNHLFETTVGWASAEQLAGKGEINVLTKHGYKKATVYRTYKTVPIVDINVNHDNHRYYTNGVSSHNTGVGKSLFMCHNAAHNLMSGQNVLYITMEMAEERIAERIDANLLGVSLDELKDLPQAIYYKLIGRVRDRAKGKLIVKEYPTASVGSANFRHLLNELNLKKNFVPDIIYIDYLNICASSRIKAGAAVNSYTYIKAIAEELRGLAVEFNVPIVSATQTTRSGFSNSDVGLEDTSESFGLPATADFMFALVTSDELRQLNQIMVKQLKNRYGDPAVYKRFVIGVDYSKMRLYNVEASAQEDLVQDEDVPVFDTSSSGSRLNEESKPVNKFNRGKFEGFK